MGSTFSISVSVTASQSSSMTLSPSPSATPTENCCENCIRKTKVEDLQNQLDVQNGQLLALQTLLGTVLDTSSSFSCGCAAPTTSRKSLWEETRLANRKDDWTFADEKGYGCEQWKDFDCSRAVIEHGYSKSGQQAIKEHCPSACAHGVSGWRRPPSPAAKRYIF